MEPHFLLLQVATAGKPFIRILWELILAHLEYVIGVIITFGGVVIASVRKVRKFVREMNLIKKEIPEIKSVLFEIRDEFKTNGGSSLRDRIESLGKKISLIGNIAWSEKELGEDGFFVTDETGKWIECNKVFLKKINSVKEDVLGNSWRGFLSHSTSEKAITNYQTAINEQRATDFPCAFKYDILGNSWHFHLYLQPMKNDGKITGFTGVLKLKP